MTVAEFVNVGTRALSALLTPTIAVVVGYIAWRQYRIARENFRLALYDRRIGLYISARAFISSVLIDARVDDQEMQNFLRSTREAIFFFDKGVADFFSEIHGHAIDLRTIKLQLSDSDAPKRAVLARRQGEIFQWFADQSSGMVERFKPYLMIADL